eukprot:3579528-Rhodomonas_salina.2
MRKKGCVKIAAPFADTASARRSMVLSKAPSGLFERQLTCMKKFMLQQTHLCAVKRESDPGHRTSSPSLLGSSFQHQTTLSVSGPNTSRMSNEGGADKLAGSGCVQGRENLPWASRSGYSLHTTPS